MLIQSRRRSFGLSCADSTEMYKNSLLSMNKHKQKAHQVRLFIEKTLNCCKKCHFLFIANQNAFHSLRSSS